MPSRRPRRIVRRMHWFTVVRILHIAAGALALAVLIVPIAARKGGRRHVLFGRIYAWAMGAVAATGAPLALHGAFAGAPSKRAGGLFLFFVALMAWDNAWTGVRVLRTKLRQGPNRAPLDLAPPIALLLGAGGILALGVSRGAVLFVVFAILGGFLAVSHLAFWLRAPRSRTESLLFHIGAMGASCIATLTAFLVVNARHLGLGTFSLVAWIAPGVVGAVAILLAQRAWRARMSRADA